MAKVAPEKFDNSCPSQAASLAAATLNKET